MIAPDADIFLASYRELPKVLICWSGLDTSGDRIFYLLAKYCSEAFLNFTNILRIFFFIRKNNSVKIVKLLLNKNLGFISLQKLKFIGKK
jgi:hypothetical protein